MINKSLLKHIRSLELKKNREKENAFVAEGPKIVGDIMDVVRPDILIATEEWYKANNVSPNDKYHIVSEDDLRKASFLQHPQQVIGIFPLLKHKIDRNIPAKELCLALDKIQDPGNLGTIIRIADWFGITNIFCGTGTADAFNPKVVQATMGSIARVNIEYADICELLDSLPADILVYGTSLDGKNIYEQQLSPTGIIIMGNEGNGISPEVMSRVNKTIFIPCYQKERVVDSLNVAIATAVTCAEFKRKFGH